MSRVVDNGGKSREATAKDIRDLRANTPSPTIWPLCGDCGEEFVLKRALLVGNTPTGKGLSLRVGWTWVRGCKHKRSKKMDRVQRARKVRS